MLIPDYVYGKIGNLGIMDSVLTYRIRFQNNGNDTAFNVLVVDTLDPILQWETMEVILATHTVQTSIDSAGKVSFYFPNIMLPDSTTDEPGSQGAVFFRIKGNVQPGYTIKNTAYIYFDFNEAVITNTSEYTWLHLETATEAVVQMDGIRCYPNPSARDWYIESLEAGTWKLSSVSGKVLQEGILSAGQSHTIAGDALPAGVYLLEVQVSDKQYRRKLVRL
jgi:hypothetical protein